jgi:hypothetical protein
MRTGVGPYGPDTGVDFTTEFVSSDTLIPTVQAICKVCFYAHTFLLMPIVRGEGVFNG